MTKSRQLQRNEETRQLILDTAKEIISDEGFENLSIRKIVKKIDYSPAIIYHYFKDKNEIVETLLRMGYMRIVKSLQELDLDRDDPYGYLRKTLEQYIRSALKSPKEYKEFMIRDDEAAIKITGLLQRGVSSEKQSVKMMCDIIGMGIDKGIFKDCDVELTAQLIWTATFGLVMKCIIEKDIPSDQIDRLIEQHLNMLFYGIMIKEEKR
jgi:AcrR family transcriptional regulator